MATAVDMYMLKYAVCRIYCVYLIYSNMQGVFAFTAYSMYGRTGNK